MAPTTTASSAALPTPRRRSARRQRPRRPRTTRTRATVQTAERRAIRRSGSDATLGIQPHARTPRVTPPPHVDPDGPRGLFACRPFEVVDIGGSLSAGWPDGRTPRRWMCNACTQSSSSYSRFGRNSRRGTVRSGSGVRSGGNRLDSGHRRGRGRRGAAAGRARGPGRHRHIGFHGSGRRVRHRRRTRRRIPADRHAGSLRAAHLAGDGSRRTTRASRSPAPGAAVRGERRGDGDADRTGGLRGRGQRHDSRRGDHRGLAGPQSAGPAAQDPGHRFRGAIGDGRPVQLDAHPARRPGHQTGALSWWTGSPPTTWARARWPS